MIFIKKKNRPVSFSWKVHRTTRHYNMMKGEMKINENRQIELARFSARFTSG